MVAVSSQPPQLEDAEQRFIVHGVSWSQYTALLDVFEDEGPRVTYLDGVVELMSPSRLHERTKTILARLLEAYAEEARIELDGHGSTTFRSEAQKRGAEPDECYSVGHSDDDAPPDLAIEIAFTPPKIDKLEVYGGLRVGEVWIYRATGLTIHILDADRYRVVERSALLPDLDLTLLLSFVRPDELQTSLVAKYRAALRAQPA